VTLTDKNKFGVYKRFTSGLICVAMLALPVLAHDCDDDETEVEARLTQAPGSEVYGSGSVSFNRHIVHADVRLENLVPGDAYTIWFAYLDHPENCQVQKCGDADFVGDDPVGVFGRMDAVIAGRSGRATFSGNFRNLKLSHHSMVWLIVFGHGKASSDHRFLARQLLTPQAPVLGAPGLGTVADGAVGVGKGVVKLLIP
jgi:hypothetical protein